MKKIGMMVVVCLAFLAGCASGPSKTQSNEKESWQKYSGQFASYSKQGNLENIAGLLREQNDLLREQNNLLQTQNGLIMMKH